MPLTREHKDWLSLTLVPGVGTALFVRLLARFRTPGEVLSAPRSALEEVVGKTLAERIKAYSEVTDVAGQERAMDTWSAHLLTLEDPGYPLRLAEIYDPPLVLFTRGAIQEMDEWCVAIVGTRRATPYGIRMAERLAAGLAARGITIVSGMAAGIDAAAHRGAIEAGGRTIAVLGNGVDIVYPPQNTDLMERIIGAGAVISQFPMGAEPSKGHFPHRNRIISGMTLGTVIVEAPLKSGALITARQASDQGREVFAVPGQVGMENSAGPHALIRDGAKLVESAEDILVELELPASYRNPASKPVEPVRDTSPHVPQPAQKPAGPVAASKDSVPGAASSRTERAILSAMSPNGSHVDEIAQACRVSVSEALSSLTILELKGLVRQFSGKRFAPR